MEGGFTLFRQRAINSSTILSKKHCWHLIFQQDLQKSYPTHSSSLYLEPPFFLVLFSLLLAFAIPLLFVLVLLSPSSSTTPKSCRKRIAYTWSCYKPPKSHLHSLHHLSILNPLSSSFSSTFDWPSHSRCCSSSCFLSPSSSSAPKSCGKSIADTWSYSAKWPKWCLRWPPQGWSTRDSYCCKLLVYLLRPSPYATSPWTTRPTTVATRTNFSLLE